MNGRRIVAALLFSLLLLGLLGSCRNVLPLQQAEKAAIIREKATPEGFLQTAEQGDEGRIRELISREPDLIGAKDADGWDALSYAAWGGHQQVHSLLLQEGAQGNLFTEAALGPWESFLRRLETNPIGVNSRDAKHKATPLIWAVRTGNQAGCEVLLSRGADIMARDRDGNTVLHQAAVTGKLEMLEFLLVAGAGVDEVNGREQTALHLVTAAGNYQACLLLLDRGASLAVPDSEGNTPLHLSAERGDFELCEYFLFFGATASAMNKDGQTPRDLAQIRGHAKVVQLLEAQQR